MVAQVLVLGLVRLVQARLLLMMQLWQAVMLPERKLRDKPQLIKSLQNKRWRKLQRPPFQPQAKD
jgi:hypothetical protein